MKYGYIIENRIQAKDDESLNRTAIKKIDDKEILKTLLLNGIEGVVGGTLLKLGNLENGVFEANTSETSGDNLWMAYNPSEHLKMLPNGKVFAGLSKDPRDYTNLANRPFDVFKPQVGDIITFTESNFDDGEADKTLVGKFVEQNASGLLAMTESETGATSFKVLEIKEIPIPSEGIGAEFIKGFICEVVHN